MVVRPLQGDGQLVRRYRIAPHRVLQVEFREGVSGIVVRDEHHLPRVDEDDVLLDSGVENEVLVLHQFGQALCVDDVRVVVRGLDTRNHEVFTPDGDSLTFCEGPCFFGHK